MLGKDHFRWVYTEYTSNFIKITDYYAKSLSRKVLPAFDDIEEKAREVEAEMYRQLAVGSNPEWDNGRDIAGQAHDAGGAFYMMAHEVVQGITNMFTAGLYHLFEQQFLQLYRLALLEPSEENNPKLFEVEKARQRLHENYRIDIWSFASWSTLKELQLVANAVKHADGPSCAALKQKRPDLFIRPNQRHAPNLGPLDLPVFQPLAGKGIYITPDDFTRYVDATKQFWEEMADTVRQLPG